jgi:hypothetical protein
MGRIQTRGFAETSTQTDTRSPQMLESSFTKFPLGFQRLNNNEPGGNGSAPPRRETQFRVPKGSITASAQPALQASGGFQVSVNQRRIQEVADSHSQRQNP